MSIIKESLYTSTIKNNHNTCQIKKYSSLASKHCSRKSYQYQTSNNSSLQQQES